MTRARITQLLDLTLLAPDLQKPSISRSWMASSLLAKPRYGPCPLHVSGQNSEQATRMPAYAARLQGLTGVQAPAPKLEAHRQTTGVKVTRAELGGV
jgi:hypothetical protein